MYVPTIANDIWHPFKGNTSGFLPEHVLRYRQKLRWPQYCNQLNILYARALIFKFYISEPFSGGGWAGGESYNNSGCPGTCIGSYAYSSTLEKYMELNINSK